MAERWFPTIVHRISTGARAILEKMTESEKAYYERRALEYDDWYLGTGLFADRVRPRWHEEVETVRAVLRSLPVRFAIDVACGTGFLTQHLPGRVIALDQSPAMLKLARERLAAGSAIQGDAFHLPFRDRAFDCLLASHFYGHLREEDRLRFLAEARRVAERTLIIDAALRDDVPPEQVQERVLNDGSRHTVYKRFFTPAQLIEELGGARVLFAGRWFVAALAVC
jgi:demethylmenaquinone methyltransferase/2-methoxy-6-polyprenyl-1,4-benzoquinol methylase